MGYLDASYRNNDDKSSQRAHVICLAEDRNPKLKGLKQSAAATSSRKSEFSESSIKEISSLKRKLGRLRFSQDYFYHYVHHCRRTRRTHALFFKGLWADLSNTYKNRCQQFGDNSWCDSSASRMLLLRKESNSGSLDDLAHASSKYCLADALTKHSAQPEELIWSLETGNLPENRYSPTIS